MNAAAAIELGLSAVIRAYGEIGAGVAVRPFQTPIDESLINRDGEKYWPCVDVRCDPPSPSPDTETAQVCTATILCGTYCSNDKQNKVLKQLYAGVQSAMDELWIQSRPGNTGDLLTLFEAITGAEEPAMRIAGIKVTGGQAPYVNGLVNMIGIMVQVDYSRSDWNGR